MKIEGNFGITVQLTDTIRSNVDPRNKIQVDSLESPDILAKSIKMHSVSIDWAAGSQSKCSTSDESRALKSVGLHENPYTDIRWVLEKIHCPSSEIQRTFSEILRNPVKIQWNAPESCKFPIKAKAHFQCHMEPDDREKRQDILLTINETLTEIVMASVKQRWPSPLVKSVRRTLSAHFQTSLVDG